VLDGWHRYRACLQAGVQPRVTEFKGTIEEATASVVSANVRRLHLDTGQLALFTVEYLLPRLEKEARAREHAGKKDPSAPGRQGSGGAGKAAVGAAKITGVSSRSVERAKFVQTHGTPEDVDAVRTGKARLKKVAAQVQARRTAATTTTRTSDPKTTSRTPPVAQTTAAPTSATIPAGRPIDDVLVPAWRELAQLLHRTGDSCATATTSAERSKHLMTVLEGFRRLYDWESRGLFVSRLDEQSRRIKKITKKNWHASAGA
jgi:hypothetical protein